MTKEEKKAVVRLMKYMKTLQQRISNPTCDNATDEEVITILGLLWEWTPSPTHRLPSKHTMEKLVGLFRGCAERDYCYISRGDVARIIRRMHDTMFTEERPELSIILNKGYENMTDTQLYDDGKWNYKETSLVELLWNMHANPQTMD
jgi:hypothetical protein